MGVSLRASLFLLIGLIASTGALAGAYQISPLRLALSAKDPIAVIKVRNEGAVTGVMQLNVMAWSQTQGKDNYSPSQDVLATPPVFSIPPGGTQIVRLGLRRPADGQRELAYRLFLQEQPRVAANEGEIRVALRFGVPIFVAPIGKTTKPLLDWRAVMTPQKTLRLEAVNPGSVHIQILGFTLTGGMGGAVLFDHKGMNYLLPGQERQWMVKVDQSPPPGTRLKIKARTDAGEFDTDVTLAQ